MSYLCLKCKKKLEVTYSISEIKLVENYPYFEKLVDIFSKVYKGL